MRLTNKKKLIMAIIMLSCILLLGGWGKQKVELLTDGKLIDLEKAIDMAQPGVDEKSQEEEATEQQEEPANTEEDQETTDSQKKTITIVIRGSQISFNGTTCKVEEISKMTKQSCTSSDRVKLMDDFAEAHVYHKVDEILNELSQSIGFEYDAQ